MDELVYIIAVFGPFMTLPQVLTIWIEKNTAGVSLTTWIAYIFIAVFWLMYGIMHKEKPIIISNICWILVELLIVVGIVIYG